MSAAAGVLGVCLALAASVPSGADASGALPAARDARVRFEPLARFTLAWTHSIEKTRWEEDYQVKRDAKGRPLLRLTRARIQGTGAGMEPPPDAVRRGTWYEYVPTDQPQGALRLTRSPYTADFDWCQRGHCRPLGALLPSDGDVTLLWPCARP